jgi:hypothetical protein
MHNLAKQPNMPAELADNLINSLSGLTAIGGDELRRQVIMMLIDHSYALGYAAGADAGLLARMRSRLAHAGQDIKLALAAIRERLTMIFRDRGRRSHQIFPPTFVIQRPTRGSVITKAVPIRCFHRDRPAAPRRGPRSSRTKMAEECDAMQRRHPRADRGLQRAVHAFTRSLPLPAQYRRPSQCGVVQFMSR